MGLVSVSKTMDRSIIIVLASVKEASVLSAGLLKIITGDIDA